jgi:DNA-binding NarL/FixJ family response regulator
VAASLTGPAVTSNHPDVNDAVPALTPAESRLLPLLATPLSLLEISRLVELPRDEVEAQARTIYHKLGLATHADE